MKFSKCFSETSPSRTFPRLFHCFLEIPQMRTFLAIFLVISNNFLCAFQDFFICTSGTPPMFQGIFQMLFRNVPLLCGSFPKPSDFCSVPTGLPTSLDSPSQHRGREVSLCHLTPLNHPDVWMESKGAAPQDPAAVEQTRSVDVGVAPPARTSSASSA